MYFKPNKIDSKLINECVLFMSNSDLFGEAMHDVSVNWVNSMINFLTNDSINQKSYIGQCAVFYRLGIQESITRYCWKQLSESNRHKANLQAIKNINLWKDKYINSLMNGKKGVTITGYQMKFPWY